MNTVPVQQGIVTYTRQYFNFKDIERNVVTIADVAKGLANTCRFAGQCENHYSVAQHSILVSQILQRMGADWRAVFGALWHDASEAFLGDVTTPLKNELPGYRELEKRVQTFLLPLAPNANHHHPGIRTADLIALRIEQSQVMFNDDRWEVLADYHDHDYLREFKISVLTPQEAYERFCDRYNECCYHAGINAPQPFLPLGE